VQGRHRLRQLAAVSDAQRPDRQIHPVTLVHQPRRFSVNPRYGGSASVRHGAGRKKSTTFEYWIAVFGGGGKK
jgi:hypothetical protein